MPIHVEAIHCQWTQQMVVEKYDEKQPQITVNIFLNDPNCKLYNALLHASSKDKYSIDVFGKRPMI